MNSDVNGDLDVNDAADASANGDARLQEDVPFVLRAWPPDEEGPGSDSWKTPAISKATVTIYLKDGSSYGVTDYWLVGGKLHYVTTYGGENSIPVGQLDLQHTVDENAARGVNFTLYNEPSRNR